VVRLQRVRHAACHKHQPCSTEGLHDLGAELRVIRALLRRFWTVRWTLAERDSRWMLLASKTFPACASFGPLLPEFPKSVSRSWMESSMFAIPVFEVPTSSWQTRCDALAFRGRPSRGTGQLSPVFYSAVTIAR
jgi:hypothetical protein